MVKTTNQKCYEICAYLERTYDCIFVTRKDAGAPSAKMLDATCIPHNQLAEGSPTPMLN